MTMELATLEDYTGSGAVLSKGFELYVEDPANATVFVRVGLVTEMPSLSDGEPENIEVTNLSSRFKEFLTGLADPTSVESAFTADFDLSDAGQKIVEQAYVDDKTNGTKTALNFECRLPVNDDTGGSRAKVSFTALAIDSDVTSGVNAQLVYNVTLRKTTTSNRSWITPA